ncbi:DUF2961 domain-containing protein [Haloferula sp. A504]|uniref:DUF2961 domain-containing protein n=1 Tax=Haloferula sp. A504 TaxID=3373601 RepID=UPI0031C70DA6|nr:DUF2961 domain-containing protein [Verrucomicrobiaceae bacterium E54]
MQTSAPLRLCAGFLLLPFLLPAHAEKAITYADLVSRLTDLERLATPIVEGEKTAASTSHDRRSRYNEQTGRYENWGANSDGGGCIRREGDAQVMVDLAGPGVLWRTWSARATGGHIRIFIDGGETPVIDKPFKDYFDDFEKDYPGLAMTLSRGRNEFIPISFSKSCKVVVDEGWGLYFHATHTLFPQGTRVEPFPGFTPEVKTLLQQASDAWLKRGENPYQGGNPKNGNHTLEIPAGKTAEVKLPGSGAIRALKIAPLDLPAEAIQREDILRELTISIFWDGESSPSVWSPLGDFFATSPGLNPFKTLPMGCIDGTFYSYWFMPFSEGARIVLTNDGDSMRRVEVDLETVALPASETRKLLRFCAAWHGGDFTGLDKQRFLKNGGDRWPDWPLLVVEGKGRYVGMTEHIWKFGGWWGEGDERFFIDGENYPSTVGTGSEDYVGYAWAAEPPFITFDSALAAVSRLRPDAQEDTSVCRFHVCDDLPFSQRFEGFIEVMPNEDCRPCLYDTCVYWYRETGARNPYPVVPPEGRRHRRPGRHEPWVTPATLQIPQPKPGTIEGEALEVLEVGSGRTWIQNMAGFRDGKWSGNAQLIWTGGKQGDTAEIGFTVAEGGKYELLVVLTKGPDYGVVQLSIDGGKLGEPIDCHDETVTTTGEISLGHLDLAAGKHTLRATLTGTNEQSKDAAGVGRHLFGLDYLRLQRPTP